MSLPSLGWFETEQWATLCSSGYWDAMLYCIGTVCLVLLFTFYFTDYYFNNSVCSIIAECFKDDIKPRQSSTVPWCQLTCFYLRSNSWYLFSFSIGVIRSHTLPHMSVIRNRIHSCAMYPIIFLRIHSTAMYICSYFISADANPFVLFRW